MNRAIEKILIKKKLGQLKKLTKGESISTFLGGFTLEEPPEQSEPSEKKELCQPTSVQRRPSRLLNTRDSETKLALRVMKKQRKISNVSGKSLESLNRSLSKLYRPNIISELQVQNHMLNKSRNHSNSKNHFTENIQFSGTTKNKISNLNPIKTHRPIQPRELTKHKSNF